MCLTKKKSKNIKCNIKNLKLEYTVSIRTTLLMSNTRVLMGYKKGKMYLLCSFIFKKLLGYMSVDIGLVYCLTQFTPHHNNKSRPQEC